MADTIIQNGVNVTSQNRKDVTVAVGVEKRLTVNNGGFNYVFKAGDVVTVNNFEEKQLRRDKVIV